MDETTVRALADRLTACGAEPTARRILELEAERGRLASQLQLALDHEIAERVRRKELEAERDRLRKALRTIRRGSMPEDRGHDDIAVARLSRIAARALEE